MSKLVEGVKDRMVAAAREAAPAVVDAAQKAATAAAEKVAEAVADAKNAAGETSAASELAAEPVTAAHAPEGAIFNPENARGNLHLGIDVAPPPSSSPCSMTTTKLSTPSTSAITPMSVPAPATCSRVLRPCCRRPR